MASQGDPRFLGLTTPGAILVGSVIIAAAIVTTHFYDSGGRRDAEKAGPPAIDEKKIVMAPVTKDDHVYGNRQAPVFLVEYSDTECPFCRSMHPLFKKLVDESQGKVGWVYRHFPLDSLHPRARRAAIAAECAAAMGGSDKFWVYLDGLFRLTPGSSESDFSADLSKIAVRSGLNRGKFRSCLSSEVHEPKVESNYRDGVKIGIVGTPTTILVNAKGEKKALVGAQSEQAVKAAIAKLGQ